MSRLDPRHLTNRTWRCALVGAVVGLVAVFLVNYSWVDAPAVSLWPYLLGSLLAGYLAKRASVSAGSAGLRAALLGFLPVAALIAPSLLPWVAENALQWWPPWDGGLTFANVVTLWVAVLVSVTVAFFGQMSGAAGGWIATKLGHDDSQSAGREGVTERLN